MMSNILHLQIQEEKMKTDTALRISSAKLQSRDKFEATERLWQWEKGYQITYSHI